MSNPDKSHTKRVSPVGIATSVAAVVLAIAIVAIGYISIVPGPADRFPTPSTKNGLGSPEDLDAGAKADSAAEADIFKAPVARSPDRPGRSAVEFAQSIYIFDLEYQERAQVAAETYLASFGSDAVLRWRPLHVNPRSILLTSYMQPGAMPERLILSPFEELTFEAVQTDYRIREKLESAGWQGRLVGAHSGRVNLDIVGGETNPSFVLKIISGPDEQPMVYSIIPTFESDVYVAIEGNPHQTINYSH